MHVINTWLSISRPLLCFCRRLGAVAVHSHKHGKTVFDVSASRRHGGNSIDDRAYVAICVLFACMQCIYDSWAIYLFSLVTNRRAICQLS
jgi:hypothetical protein